jgi:hypothetical protein
MTLNQRPGYYDALIDWCNINSWVDGLIFRIRGVAEHAQNVHMVQIGNGNLKRLVGGE